MGTTPVEGGRLTPAIELADPAQEDKEKGGLAGEAEQKGNTKNNICGQTKNRPAKTLHRRPTLSYRDIGKIQPGVGRAPTDPTQPREGSSGLWHAAGMGSEPNAKRRASQGLDSHDRRRRHEGR